MCIWQDLRASLHEALELTGAHSRDVWKPFWAAQQRFFKLLCISMKVRLPADSNCHHQPLESLFQNADPPSLVNQHCAVLQNRSQQRCITADGQDDGSGKHCKGSADARVVGDRCRRWSRRPRGRWRRAAQSSSACRTTGEAAADALGLAPGQACGSVSPTREMLSRFIGTHFPVLRETAKSAGAGARSPVPFIFKPIVFYV